MSADEATDVCDVVVARPNGECLYKLHYTADGVIVCTVVGFWSDRKSTRLNSSH